MASEESDALGSLMAGLTRRSTSCTTGLIGDTRHSLVPYLRTAVTAVKLGCETAEDSALYVVRFEDICRHYGGLKNQVVMRILRLDLDSPGTNPLHRFRGGSFRRCHGGVWAFPSIFFITNSRVGIHPEVLVVEDDSMCARRYSTRSIGARTWTVYSRVIFFLTMYHIHSDRIWFDAPSAYSYQA